MYLLSGFRDFVFRQVFESTGSAVDAVPGPRIVAIANAVKDLIEIDDDLFVSKNVVDEILMEIQTRKAAFESLKVLDSEVSCISFSPLILLSSSLSC